MPWDAWCAFARVVAESAARRKWPDSAFGMLNLGLVEGRCCDAAKAVETAAAADPAGSSGGGGAA